MRIGNISLAAHMRRLTFGVSAEWGGSANWVGGEDDVVNKIVGRVVKMGRK